MKYAVEMESGAMIYPPSFMKIGSGIQRLMGIHRQQGDIISLLLFFQNKKSRLKRMLQFKSVMKSIRYQAYIHEEIKGIFNLHNACFH
jgi:hypothetical protein